MSIWFWISVIVEIFILPIYILSLEHTKLQKRFGDEKGKKIGESLGLISGWGFFFFLFGVWVTPQPRFILPFPLEFSFNVPFIKLTIPIIHLILFFPLILVVLWVALKGVVEMGLKVAETHRAEKVVTTGVYSRIRHPQYLGTLLAHIAISLLFSAWYSFLLTPFLGGYLFLLAWKEEKELVKEFGREYEEYKSITPMFIFSWRKD